MRVGTEAAVIDIYHQWQKECDRDIFRYPVKEGAKGFYFHGFCRRNDSSMDFMGWYGLVLEVEGKTAVRAACTVTIVLCEGEALVRTVDLLAERGQNRIELPFAEFPAETAAESRWQFISGIEISFGGEAAEQLSLTGLKAYRGRGLFAEMPVKGKSQEVGGTVSYEGVVHNCTDAQMAVELQQAFEGWESMTAELFFDGAARENRRSVLLEPYGAASFRVSLKNHDYMVPGGHENTRIRITGRNSYGTFVQQEELKTMRSLPHPYLYHDKKGWREVMDKINAYPVYEKPYREYIDTADRWEVKPTAAGRDYCYETSEETNTMSAAYAYALTGDRRYAEKLASFFRYFTDENAGYPAKLKGCNQSYVQEGHFFQHLAIPYDILYDSGELADADKAAVERTFRLYMDMLDKHIRSGQISNWLISEITGALYCALAIQDMDRALRFLYGNGGLVEQFRHGIFNDGWWHECSVGYNTWVSSMMIHAAHAMCPFGYDLAHAHFQIPYNQEINSTYAGRAPKILSGMYNRKWGGNTKNFICIKDLFDAVLPFLDYRGVLFGIADSDEKMLSGVHFGSTYDLAYTYYRDADYIPVMLRNPPDPIFGHPEITEIKGIVNMCTENAYADNIGIAMLRSRKEGREQSEQIQAVLRYGSHGGAHGHFDTSNLLSIMRYGRSFYNPENCWWGYAHFMYKFYVQCSLTKNMVVVDDKLQVPADSKRILFYNGKRLQAAGVEVRTKWAYPPYGGMVYYQDGQTNTREALRERCAMNHCYLPIVEGEDGPVYGELSGYTEEILQRRVIAVTDDYIVLFDFVQGEAEHTYDSLMQIKGFEGITGGSVRYEKHTEQLDSNPVSDAQFITDCDWYKAEGATKAHFETVFTEEDAGEHLRCDRSNYNEPGVLKMDVHTAWPLDTEQIVGRVAVYDGWAAAGTGYTIPLEYRVEGDGRELVSGAFDGWILGRGEIDVDLSGVKELALIVKQGDICNENKAPVRTPQGCFWGSAVIVQRDGSRVDVGDMIRRGAGGITFENVDKGYGIGKDYQDGRVTIVGTVYENAVPASTLDHEKEGRITVPLEGLQAGRLLACVGVDAFAGDESQKRKTYAVRTRGQKARYITVIEPYETTAAIREVLPVDKDTVKVVLQDGRIQTLCVEKMEAGQVRILMEEQYGEEKTEVETAECVKGKV